MKINGLTFYQWAREMFAFENCAECGKGVRNHSPAIALGNWFAVCKATSVDPFTTAQPCWMRAGSR